MTSEDNINIFFDHTKNAIAKIRNTKKRPDNKSITEFIQKNHSSNAHCNFIEDAIKKIFSLMKIPSKKRKSNSLKRKSKSLRMKTLP